MALPPALDRPPNQLDESSQPLFEFAFPDCHHEPSVVDKCLLVLFVSVSVAGIGLMHLGLEQTGWHFKCHQLLILAAPF